MFEVVQTPVFSKWLDKLRDAKAQARISARLILLEQGHLGDSKSVGDGITELRIFCGPGYRLYLTQRAERMIILLCGGDKSTQRRDIERAKKISESLED